MVKCKVLSIDYYNEFQCIGNQCEDHCCKDWSITVDKKTYNKYKKLPASEFKKKLNDNINRNRKANGENSYGKINLINKKCPMLSEERLCEVYSNLGPDSMCYTCRTYPRIYNKVNDTLEQCLTVSCIEAARNLLLRENPIEFNLDIKDIEDIKVVKEVNTIKGKDMSSRYFNEIREFAIGLIQNRRLTIENRLAVLGLFIKRIDENSTDAGIVERSIAEFTREIDNGVYDNLLENLLAEDKFDAQLEFLTQLYNIVISKRINNERYVNNLKNIIESLQLSSGDNEKIKNAYSEALTNSYRGFMAKYQYIYENYLVNYMFKTMFPKGEKSLLDTYIGLIVQFSILKMNLIGVCGYYKEEMDTKKVINLIQSYAVVTEHDQFLANKIQSYLKENELNTLAHALTIMGR